VFGRPATPLFCGVLLAAAGPLRAQDLMPGDTPGGAVRLPAPDRAVLESQESRKTLPCTVTPTKPELGFDLIFHAGYEIGVPVKDLAAKGNRLTTVFRVIPEGHAANAAYFTQRVPVPALDGANRGSASLSGAFDVGEGKYHIDWLMRDSAERVCSFHWDAEATLAPHDRQIALTIPAGTARPFYTEAFRPERPIEKDRGESPVHVKAIVNFAPQNAAAASLRPAEIGTLISILRAIARDRGVARISLVAFNLQQQKVLYRQRAALQIDFPALGRALRALNLGTTDLKRLAEKHEGTQFLSGLIATEVGGVDDGADAVVFAGPRLSMDDAIPPGALKQLGAVKFPVFYMSYNLSPVPNLWHDTIGNTVKYLKGMEFSISRPRDLFFAWSEIMSRVRRSKAGATVAGNAPSQ
jgi:hypothetical protein